MTDTLQRLLNPPPSWGFCDCGRIASGKTAVWHEGWDIEPGEWRFRCAEGKGCRRTKP